MATTPVEQWQNHREVCQGAYERAVKRYGADSERAHQEALMVKECEEILTFYKAFDGVPSGAINAIRRAMLREDGDHMNPDCIAAFMCARTDSDLLALRGVGKKTVIVMRLWAESWAQRQENADA